MKKIFILMLAGLALAACKKDYTCTCSEKQTFFGQISESEYTFTIEGANTTQAQAACNEATLKQTDGDGDYYQITCDLKK